MRLIKHYLLIYFSIFIANEMMLCPGNLGLSLRLSWEGVWIGSSVSPSSPRKKNFDNFFFFCATLNFEPVIDGEIVINVFNAMISFFVWNKWMGWDAPIWKNLYGFACTSWKSNPWHGWEIWTSEPGQLHPGQEFLCMLVFSIYIFPRFILHHHLSFWKRRFHPR